MSYAFFCNYCAQKILNVATIGDREAHALRAHLTDAHPSVVDEMMLLGDLLRNFTIVEQL